MAAIQAQQATIGGKVSTYQKQLDQLAQIRHTLQQTARATGEWSTETFRTISASQKLTQSIVDQKLAAREFFKDLVTGRKRMREVIAEQHSLRNAFATQMTGSGFGRSTVDLYAPKEVARNIRSWTTEMGVYSQALRSVSQQTVNWGKNTQWAGRQMMVGLTVPLGIAAVGMARQAYEIDRQLTRIAKVYDTQSTAGLEGAEKQIAAEAELGQIRERSLDMATRAANTYGAAVKDTLDVEAQLAASGLSGDKLMSMSNEVMRVATLGEMETQTAVDMTISLTTAFRDQIKTTEDLAEAFNFFNTVENSTSLQIADIAEAIPRAASAMSALGVDVKEMTSLMVALRESGVDPAIGANALKSATSTLLNPTKEAIEYWDTALNKDLPRIVDEAGGNLFKFMQRVGEELHGLDPQVVQTAVTTTFGKYQFDRATALVTNFGDAMSGVQNQTAKSFELMGQDTSEWADTADTEMQRFQQSVSGRFKRAVEGFKAQLIPLGTTILSLVTPVIEGLKGVVEWFNDLGDTNKKIILWGLAIMGLAGPLVMIAGIFGNLLGHAMKIPAVLGGMVARFRPMTAQMTANELVAKRAAMTWDTQTSSAAMLTQSLNTLTAAMEANAVAQGHMLSGSGVLNVGGLGSGVSMYRSESGQLRRRVIDPTTKKVRESRASEKSPEGMLFLAAEAAAAEKASAGMAQHAERTKMSWGQIAGAMGGVVMAVSAFSMMDMSSASIGQNLMTAAMFASSAAMILPSFRGASGFATKIANALGGNKFAAMGKNMGEMVTYAGVLAGARGGLIGKMGGGLANVGAALHRILPMALRFFGPVGIIAGGIALIVTLSNKMTELSRRQDEINKSAQNWADILGYVHQQGSFNGGEVNPQSGGFASLTADAEALKKANEGLADALAEAGEESDNFASAYRIAVSEALKVITSGGTVDNARRAFQVALRAAGAGPQTIDRLTIDFEEIDLANPAAVANAIRREIQEALDNVDPGSSNVFMRLFQNNLDDESESSAKAAGAAAARAFFQGANTRDQIDALDQVTTGMNDQFSGAFRNIMNQLDEEGQTKFRELGITNMTQLTTAMRETMANGSMDIFDWKEIVGFEGTQALDAWEEAMRGVFEGMRAEGLITEKQFYSLVDALGGIGDIPELKDVLQLPDPKDFISAREASLGYEEALTRAGLAGTVYNEEQQLVILNTWRARAGQEAATSTAQGFSSATQNAANSVEGLAEAEAEAAEEASRLTNALRNTMSGAWSGIFDQADDALQDANNAEIEGIQRGGEAAQKRIEARADAQERAYEAEEEALESHWDNLEKTEKAGYDNQIETIRTSTDARIESIQAAIQAEEDAEERRRKIFEAEQRRIQRLSEMANRSIDFNAALSSGDLDEAAKIYNTGQAATSQWALDDAQMSAEDQADARRKGLESQIEGIESERDARISALEAARDARLEALEVERKAEERALEQRKKNAQESIRIAQEAARESTEASVESARRKQEADRRALEMELAALREYVPKNEADLREHIGRVQKAYDEYGHGLQISGDQWSTIIGDELSMNIAKSAQALQTDIDWAQIGTYISENIGKGTGMTAAQVSEFLRTGKFPEGPQATTPAWAPASSVPKPSSIGRGYDNRIMRHSGGEVGWSAKDRTGVPRSAGLYPSEVNTVLKKGEFVVDAQGTKHNKELLEKINGSSSKLMEYEGVRHAGGIIDSGAAFAGLYGAAIAKLHEIVGMAKIRRRQTESTYGGTPGMGAGTFVPGSGRYPARQWMRESPNTTAAKQYVMQRWGSRINGVGTVGSRSITSDHPWGKALDVMITRPGANHYKQPGGIALGTEIANHFVNNPDQFGTKYVIWRDRITSGGGWKPYGHPSGGGGDTLQHRDHPHISLLHKGGLAGRKGFSAPQLDVGGKVLYDNTLANLHKDETMLTRPLSRDLEHGIKNLDLNRANEYNVEIVFTGPVNTDIDFKKAVREVIDERETRNGKARKVTVS